MRQIKVHKWQGKKETEENTTMKVLTQLLTTVDPKRQPRGLDKFRSFNRIAKSFDKAEETGIINIEEADYSFLKDMLNEVPGIWGLDKEAAIAIELFLESEEVKENAKD